MRQHCPRERLTACPQRLALESAVVTHKVVQHTSKQPGRLPLTQAPGSAD
jgi:hypothetical protein